MNDLINRQAAIDEIEYELEMINSALDSITLDFNARERLRQRRGEAREILNSIQQLPSAEPKRGKWILDRSGAYCCSSCMEPCAGYIMMKPRDRFCKMCGAKMEVTE